MLRVTFAVIFKYAFWADAAFGERVGGNDRARERLERAALLSTSPA